MLLDFQALEPPPSPNWYLACPPGWVLPACRETTPTFEVPLEQLREALVSLAAAEPRTHLMKLDRTAMQAEFQQKTAVFGFLDRVFVSFVFLGEQRSSLAIYSYAVSGYSDFGVNRRRVRRWISALPAAISDLPPADD